MNYRKIMLAALFIGLAVYAKSQTVSQIKKELQQTNDPFGYVKFKLKKKYSLDTVTVFTTSNFAGVADSLAYKGKTGMVYGPFGKQGERYLVKLLAKVPNTFYHISHIVLDTSVYRKNFADSLANMIIRKIKEGSSSFESMARTYSSDNVSAIKGGDLGWFIRGIMLPQLDYAIANHKKGEIFKVWTSAGLHIVHITDNPKKDNGFALFLRVFL